MSDPPATESGQWAWKLPEIEREFIEIYPVAWHALKELDIRSIMTQRSFNGLDQITLYAHIPFCPELCAFCGFNKTSFRQATYERYVDMLIREIDYYRDHPDLDGRQVSAIYIGGGTGSTLEPSDLERLVDAFHSVFSVEENCELTIESHPATLSDVKLSAYASAGVNRLSIGTQSFSDRKLAALERHHTAAQNLQALEDARSAGIDSISIDLLYRVPGETLAELEADLATIVEQNPTNVACYSLIVEGTAFERTLASLPDRTLEDRLRAEIEQVLVGSGYERWSLNDFCQPGRMTNYNINYWVAPQTLLLGFGAGAHSHYYGGHIWVNAYGVNDYISAIKTERFPGVSGQAVSVDELMHRFMVMGLHCLDVDMAQLEQTFGVNGWEAFSEPIRAGTEFGWLARSGDHLKVTSAGEPYLFNVSKMFFSEGCASQRQPWSKHLRQVKAEHPVVLGPRRRSAGGS